MSLPTLLCIDTLPACNASHPRTAVSLVGSGCDQASVMARHSRRAGTGVPVPAPAPAPAPAPDPTELPAHGRSTPCLLRRADRGPDAPRPALRPVEWASVSPCRGARMSVCLQERALEPAPCSQSLLHTSLRQVSPTRRFSAKPLLAPLASRIAQGGYAACEACHTAGDSIAACKRCAPPAELDYISGATYLSHQAISSVHRADFESALPLGAPSHDAIPRAWLPSRREARLLPPCRRRLKTV